MKKHKFHGKTQNPYKKNVKFMENAKNHEQITFSKNAATALGPSSKDRVRCEVSAGIKELSVRHLSVEL